MTRNEEICLDKLISNNEEKIIYLIDSNSLKIDVNKFSSTDQLISCATVLPTRRKTEQIPIVQNILNQAGEESKQQFKQKIKERRNISCKNMEPFIAQIDSGSLSTMCLIMMELPDIVWEFQADEECLKHTIAKCLEVSNEEEMCTLYIIYPSPYVLVDDFANSFFFALNDLLSRHKTQTKDLENNNNQKRIHLKEIVILVEDNDIEENLIKAFLKCQNELFREAENLCVVCKKNPKAAGSLRKCTICSESYPSKFDPEQYIKSHSELDKHAEPLIDIGQVVQNAMQCEAKKPNKLETKARNFCVELIKYIRKDLNYKWADHHLDKIIGGYIYVFIRVRLKVTDAHIVDYGDYMLAGYKGGSYLGQLIPTKGYVPRPLCSVVCGLAIGATVCSCRFCYKCTKCVIKCLAKKFSETPAETQYSLLKMSKNSLKTDTPLSSIHTKKTEFPLKDK